ncbi:MAG: MBL fold metallo-hydrolase [Niabella sp.]|nr:MBL fold metallo-hydrolase [Niabella sp.]
MILFFFVVILILVAATNVYIRLPQFGRAPRGERLQLIKQSRQFKNGKFENISFTPTLTEGYSMWGVIKKQLFTKLPRRRPAENIPSIKTDLSQLPSDRNLLVWFGHSSYFMQIDGKRFLVDPVLSGNASPLPGTARSFKGSDIYTPEDLPTIDYLLITHDHYDHLDYKTIRAIQSKVKQVVCPLGVAGHLIRWGYDEKNIIEKDWNETTLLDTGFNITSLPARHFSGRGFTRNNTLWTSYLLQAPSLTVYIGGDSGYDSHFTEIGNKFPGIDIAILENGQYNPAWHAIHMLPPEVLQAAKDLKAKRLFPVHSSKFALAQHPWDDPLKEVTRLNETDPIPLITPMIGGIVYLDDSGQQFEPWWTKIQ